MQDPQTEATHMQGKESVYDLPILYHLPAIETLKHEDEEDVERYNYSTKMDGNRVSRFEHLDAQILLKRLKKSPTHMYVRTAAVQKLYKDVEKMMDIMCRRLHCELGEQDREEIPHRVFSWTKADFINRRKLKSMLWVELIRKHLPEDCLEKKKLKFDLEELRRYVKLLLGEVIKESLMTHKSAGASNAVVESVREMHDFLDILEELEEELAKNSETMRKHLNDRLAMAINTHGDESRRAVIADLEFKIMNTDVWDPIEVRYQIGYYCVMADQQEMIVKQQERVFTKEIKRYTKMLQREKHRFQCTLNAMYVEIEFFKNCIDNYNFKLKDKLETIDNEISYKKLTLDKLNSQRKYLTEQIQRFHDEIEAARLAAIAERERQTKLAQQRMDDLLAKQEAAAAKKKAKKKKNKK